MQNDVFFSSETFSAILLFFVRRLVRDKITRTTAAHTLIGPDALCLSVCRSRAPRARLHAPGTPPSIWSSSFRAVIVRVSERDYRPNPPPRRLALWTGNERLTTDKNDSSLSFCFSRFNREHARTSLCVNVTIRRRRLSKRNTIPMQSLTCRCTRKRCRNVSALPVHTPPTSLCWHAHKWKYVIRIRNKIPYNNIQKAL